MRARSSQLKRWVAIAAILSVGVQPLAAFDTFWHSAATSAACRQFQFSADAANIVQFGNFSGPDFFGPLYDVALGEKVENWEKMNASALEKAKQFMVFRNTNSTLVVRKSAIFMHFDNLYGELNTNSKFDSLFTRLLKNTQQTIDTIYLNPNLNEGNKKMGILMAMGGSLHMVQDFYSHSDWIHNDFAKMGLPLVRMPWGKDRAPTWFEVRAKLGDPDRWPFKVQSGVYPPPPGNSPNTHTHTHMNHDNSQLFYEGASQVTFHNAGPIPATAESDAAGHQLLAANSAAGASMEWIRMVEEDAVALKAIQFAQSWDLKKYNAAMLHDLEGGLGATLLLSCVFHKWDGDNPSAKRAAECSGMLKYAPFGIPAGAVLPGMSGIIPTPYNEFWAVHTRQNLVEHLTAGVGTPNGHYRF
jgi:hypothetical protein